MWLRNWIVPSRMLTSWLSVHSLWNSILLETLGIAYEKAGTTDAESTGFSFMTVACVMVGILVLLAAGLVIYNILKIAVSKRVREYGTLRAIGGEKKQLYRLVAI